MESSRIHGGAEDDNKSSNESGWTAYLVSSPINEKNYTNINIHNTLENELGGESDDSTSSDATSGLSHEGFLGINMEGDHDVEPDLQHAGNRLKIKDSEKVRNKKAGEISGMKPQHEPMGKSAAGDQCDVFCGGKFTKGK